MATSESIDIQAPHEEVLKVLIDVNSYPSWARAVKQAMILNRDEQGRPRQAQFQVDAFVKMLNYIVEFEYTPNTISWQMVSGNMKRNKGSFRVVPSGGATRLIYTFDQDPGVLLPSIFVQQGIRSGATQLLLDLKKRMETD